jgi:hypothetical protein
MGWLVLPSPLTTLILTLPNEDLSLQVGVRDTGFGSLRTGGEAPERNRRGIQLGERPTRGAPTASSDGIGGYDQ